MGVSKKVAPPDVKVFTGLSMGVGTPVSLQWNNSIDLKGISTINAHSEGFWPPPCGSLKTYRLFYR